MKRKTNILLMLLLTIILYSCKNNNSTTMKNVPADNTVQPTTTEPVTEAPKKSNHTEWKIVESKKHYCVERMGL
ncbi:hypothetical protein [[Clostridium] polysaccharolyticum]|uniref:Uncharacterized protein n=1 Tax=[Clostridium] polysaccharolyticum TaxID=29364 RepID=A0A1H9YSF9_9FIRM|nr:hypothetical protein [[Clostridium] polysaccharolyticum]SES72056.1 hypothetical protein SAMN04487772_102184 [[Clostridium] polysaccharolyticum]